MVDWAFETHGDWWGTGLNLKFFQESPDDETLQNLENKFANWNKTVEGKFKEVGTNFVAGDKMTIGDLILFTQYAACAVNDRPVREKQTAACAKALENSPFVNAWIARMKDIFSEYLASRPQAAI